MTVDPGERELLAQFLCVAVVGVDVDRALKEDYGRPVLREFVRGPATTIDIPPHDSNLLDATRLFTKRGVVGV